MTEDPDEDRGGPIVWLFVGFVLCVAALLWLLVRQR